MLFSDSNFRNFRQKFAFCCLVLILWKPKFHTQEILWILQCCGMVEVTTALECRREQWMYENLKGGGEVKVFYKGKSLSEAVTYSWCLLNADSLIKFADDTNIGEKLICLKAGLLFRGTQAGTLSSQARANTSFVSGKKDLLADVQAGATLQRRTCGFFGGHQAECEPGLYPDIKHSQLHPGLH